MPSLLATALELERLLLDRLELPSPSSSSGARLEGRLHPLAIATSAPEQALDDLATTVRESIATLRTGITQFPLSLQSNLDANDDLDSANNQAKLARDRYLTQLREAASTEAALHTLASRADSNSHAPKRKRIRAGDDRWKVATPRSNGMHGSTIQLLETVAADLELVTFRDDDDGGGDAAMSDPSGAEPTKPVTLSIGGKVMVVDFTLIGSRVDRVKVAYVIAGQDRQSAFAATKLERLFALVQEDPSARAPGADEGDDFDDDAREQMCWKGVRKVLEELKALGEESERTGRDVFEELERLGQGLAAQLSKDAGAEGRFLLQSIDSLYPVLVYHATAAARLSSHWQRIIVATQEELNDVSDARLRRLSPTSADVQALLTPGSGVYSVRFDLLSHLSRAVPLSYTESDGAAASSASLFLATLEPELPICASTGRDVLTTLGLGGPALDATEPKPKTDGLATKPDLVDQGPLDSEPQDRSGLSLPSWLELVTSQMLGSGMRATALSDLSLEQIIPSAPRHLVLRYQLPSPAAAVHSRSQPPPPPPPAGFLASYLPFVDPATLIAALPSLAAQATLNELLASALQTRFGVTVRRRAEEGVVGPHKGSKQSALRDPDELTLEKLLAPPALDAPLIVPVSLSSKNNPPLKTTTPSAPSPQEALVVSFPFPALTKAPASLLAMPISLSISTAPRSPQPDTTSAIVLVAIAAPEAVLQYLGSADERAELEQRVGRILREAGIVGFAIEAVVKALEARV